MENILTLIISTLLIFSYSCANTGKEQPHTGNLVSAPRHFLNTISPHIQALISEHLDDPISVFTYLTKTTSSNSKYLLKHYITEMLKISEFESIQNDEPELKKLYSYKWARYDKFSLFRCLIEDISTGKKKFHVLLRPLLKYLVRIFKELNDQERPGYLMYLYRTSPLSDIENILTKICTLHGQYDLTIKLEPYPLYWNKYFLSVKNKESLLEFFKSNHHLGLQYKRSFMNEQLKSNVYAYCHLDAVLYNL